MAWNTLKNKWTILIPTSLILLCIAICIGCSDEARMYYTSGERMNSNDFAYYYHIDPAGLYNTDTMVSLSPNNNFSAVLCSGTTESGKNCQWISVRRGTNIKNQWAVNGDNVLAFIALPKEQRDTNRIHSIEFINEKELLVKWQNNSPETLSMVYNLINNSVK